MMFCPLYSGSSGNSTYVSDGKYFYLFSGFLSHNDPDIEDHFLVYDGQMELVDEFSVPDTNTYTMDPPIGGEKYQYLVFDDEETGEWGLYIWDKSEIETLHGKAYTQQKIVYEV